MPRRRRSYEAGHQPKLLVVIDDTEECDRAVYYASRRAARIGANVIMLRVIETQDASQQWLGVADIMRAEAHEEADAELAKYATRANGIAGITPERAVREGDKAEEILRLIANTSSEGPGPLVATIGRTAGDYPIPVAIVPGHLSDEEIDALS
jgi:nucleotide-binding universal stress UspA family protein